MNEKAKSLLTMQGTLSAISRVSEHISSLVEKGNDSLEEKIIASGKNINDCWKYITHKAKELATDNSVCVDDETVFGWAVHYYEDNADALKEMSPSSAKTTTTSPRNTTTSTKTTTSAKKSVPKPSSAEKEAILKALAAKADEEEGEESVSGFTIDDDIDFGEEPAPKATTKSKKSTPTKAKPKAKSAEEDLDYLLSDDDEVIDF